MSQCCVVVGFIYHYCNIKTFFLYLWTTYFIFLEANFYKLVLTLLHLLLELSHLASYVTLDLSFLFVSQVLKVFLIRTLGLVNSTEFQNKTIYKWNTNFDTRFLYILELQIQVTRLWLGLSKIRTQILINYNQSFWLFGSQCLVDGSLEGKMVGTGSSNSRLVNGDNRAIGVSNEAIESRDVSSSIDGGGSSSSVDTSNNSLGGQMIGTGGSNSRLINRNNSSIRMSYKVCVQIKRSTIACMTNCMTITNSSMNYLNKV